MIVENKFRAWDKRNKKLIMPDEEIFMRLDCSQVGHWRRSWDDEYILMQYSGLKDKNEKEIYEGDIVKIYTGEICDVIFPVGQGFKIRFYDNKKKEGFTRDLYHEIHFSGPSISIDEHGHDIGKEYYIERMAEVIGNIYQNLELLHEK